MGADAEGLVEEWVHGDGTFLDGDLPTARDLFAEGVLPWRASAGCFDAFLPRILP